MYLDGLPYLQCTCVKNIVVLLNVGILSCFRAFNHSKEIFGEYCCGAFLVNLTQVLLLLSNLGKFGDLVSVNVSHSIYVPIP